MRADGGRSPAQPGHWAPSWPRSRARRHPAGGGQGTLHPASVSLVQPPRGLRPPFHLLGAHPGQLGEDCVDFRLLLGSAPRDLFRCRSSIAAVMYLVL